MEPLSSAMTAGPTRSLERIRQVKPDVAFTYVHDQPTRKGQLMNEHVTIEDIGMATRARARMRQQIEGEILADTFTPEKYAQLYTELQEQIKDLLLPSWWWGMEWKAYMMTSTFFEKLVFDIRKSIEERGVTTDEMIEEQVRERMEVLD